jgi:hypothetical protein
LRHLTTDIPIARTNGADASANIIDAPLGPDICGSAIEE